MKSARAPDPAHAVSNWETDSSSRSDELNVTGGAGSTPGSARQRLVTWYGTPNTFNAVPTRIRKSSQGPIDATYTESQTTFRRTPARSSSGGNWTWARPVIPGRTSNRAL